MNLLLNNFLMMLLGRLSKISAVARMNSFIRYRLVISSYGSAGATSETRHVAALGGGY